MTSPLTTKRLRRAQRKLERLKQRGDVPALIEAFARGDWFAPSALLELAREARANGEGSAIGVVASLGILIGDRSQPVDLRGHALQLLAETGDERAVNVLVDTLADPTVELASIRALRVLGDPRAIERLLDLVGGSQPEADPEHRARLGQILWTLVGLTNGGADTVARLAADRRVEALATIPLAIGETDAQDAVLERLAAEAISALGDMDDEVSRLALQSLWECELDGLWWRRLVLEALVRRGDHEAVEAAARALQQWHGGDRPSEASVSLARALAGQDDDRGRRGLVLRLLARVEHAGDCHDRRGAIVELRDLDGSEALVPVEARDLLSNAARDPLFFGSGRVFDSDALYAVDSAAEEQAREAAVEVADRLRALERRSQRDLLL